MSEILDGPPLIQLQEVTKNFGDRKVLNRVNFKVFPRRVHAFLGPNGAGKSTTLKIIAGLLNHSSGDVKFAHPLRMGLLLEHPPLYVNMTVKDYLNFVLQIHRAEGQGAYDKTLEVCQLGDVQNRSIRNLSSGYRQRVALAQALIHDPEFIILDEPTVGLDPKAVDHIYQVISGLKEKHTILLSTHQLHEADRFCDDLTVINNGMILATGPIDEIRSILTPSRILDVEISGDVVADIEKLTIKLGHSIEKVRIQDGRTYAGLQLNPSGPAIGQITKEFVDAGLALLSMNERKMDLEGIFRQLTEKERSL